MDVAPTRFECEQAYANLARVYIKLGRLDDARAALEKITLAELQSARELIGRQLMQ